MTIHQLRRVVFTLITMLVASIAIGTPISLAASPVHPPIANHVFRPDAQFHGTQRAISPPPPAAHFRDHGDDPLAALHFE
jgi:hypothetical protein